MKIQKFFFCSICLGNGILDQFNGIIQKDDWQRSNGAIETCHVLVGHLFGNGNHPIVIVRIRNRNQIRKNLLKSIPWPNTIPTI